MEIDPQPDTYSVDIGKLFCCPTNPRRNDAAIPHVAASLRRFGWQQPIVAKRSGEVIAGNTRLKAAQELGMSEVPVWWFDGHDLDATAYQIADNRTHEFADWEERELAALLEQLQKEDALDGVGYSEEDLDALLAELRAQEDEDRALDDEGGREPPPVAVAQQGDLWALGDHLLLCGDSTSLENAERVMQGDRAALVATDPPYLIDYVGDRPNDAGKDWSDRYREVDIQDPEGFYRAVFANVLEVLGPRAAISSCPKTRPLCRTTTYDSRLPSRSSGAMPDFLPLQLLLATFGGWVNRRQANAIEYLLEENRVLREQLGGRRLRLTDDQRRRLAAKGKRLGRALLYRITTIVTPDTILRWHRRLIALKHTHPGRRVGRPGLMKAIRATIVRIADDNPTWGYCRIQGELKKVGHRVARSTIAKTLKDHGVPPTSGRSTSWRTFLATHKDAIAATDFFTAEVWTTRGLQTFHVLFAIDHATRAIEILGCTPRPDRAFMAQVARNLTDPIDGSLRNKRYLVLDRDSKFTDQFHRILGDAGVITVRTAFQAPDMNAIAERFIGSIRRECLDRVILLGEGHLRRVLREYVAHYNAERPHQGVGNQPITPSTNCAAQSGAIVEHERLGGLLRSYSRVT